MKDEETYQAKDFPFRSITTKIVSTGIEFHLPNDSWNELDRIEKEASQNMSLQNTAFYFIRFPKKIGIYYRGKANGQQFSQEELANIRYDIICKSIEKLDFLKNFKFMGNTEKESKQNNS